VPKRSEIDYIKNIGPEAVRHARHKPFSDPKCGRYLMDLGAVLSLLPAPPARVLDLGVGTGWTSMFLARRGFEVVGQDIAPDMIALAEANADTADPFSLRFLVCDYERLELDDEFDAALFYDALHHAEDERLALAGVHRALRPGGVCITVEPGAGHAANAQAVAERFGVTEKDMPPRHIMAIGRDVGFREFRVYRRPVVDALLLEPAHAVGVGRRLRSGMRRLAKVFIGPAWQRRQALRGSHIVWMRK
jgi:SAM-dependent methyltransferase